MVVLFVPVLFNSVPRAPAQNNDKHGVEATSCVLHLIPRTEGNYNTLTARHASKKNAGERECCVNKRSLLWWFHRYIARDGDSLQARAYHLEALSHLIQTIHTKRFANCKQTQPFLMQRQYDSEPRCPTANSKLSHA